MVSHQYKERERLFPTFYITAINNSNLAKWNQLILALNIEHVSSHSEMLYQYILCKYLQISLEFRNQTLLKLDTPKDHQLDQSEEETLRYVAGNIAYSIDNRTVEGKMAKELITYWG